MAHHNFLNHYHLSYWMIWLDNLVSFFSLIYISLMIGCSELQWCQKDFHYILVHLAMFHRGFLSTKRIVSSLEFLSSCRLIHDWISFSAFQQEIWDSNVKKCKKCKRFNKLIFVKMYLVCWFMISSSFNYWIWDSNYDLKQLDTWMLLAKMLSTKFSIRVYFNLTRFHHNSV